MNDPFDRLCAFYESLDSIPTPDLRLPKPSAWSYLKLILAPFGAAAIAYLFILSCALAPGNPRQVPQFFPPSDREAMAELRQGQPIPPRHVQAGQTGTRAS